MATMTENDDEELEIIETDEIPEQEAEAPDEPEAEAPEPEEAEESDEDDEDDRLGDSEEESEDEIVNRNRIKRQKRRQARKQAQERLESELRMLREVNANLMKKVGGIETDLASQRAHVSEQRLAAAQDEVRQAENIIARAVEAGNGADVAAAIRLRDEAIRKAQEAEAERSRHQPASGPDPRMRTYAQQWIAANPWYTPGGTDEASVAADSIDRTLMSEGYDPTSVEYFRELTRRVEARFGTTSEPEAKAPARRKAPPMGSNREHVPTSTKRGVYVTPERRAALEELGVWEDPVRRQSYLKSFAEYDRNNANRR